MLESHGEWLVWLIRWHASSNGHVDESKTDAKEMHSDFIGTNRLQSRCGYSAFTA